MEAKDKAKQLVNKIKTNLWEKRNIKITLEDAIVLAHLTVDEILNSNYSYYDYGGDGWKIIDNSDYWQEVKTEIDQL